MLARQNDADLVSKSDDAMELTDPSRYLNR